MPPAAHLITYLNRIDRSRVYANWGPLCEEFQAQICSSLSLGKGTFVCASSGTSALIAAILAITDNVTKDRPLALVPSFTFVATAIAAERCGYKPFFCDVDPKTWSLDPDRLKNEPVIERAGLVIPVAPLGRAVAQEPWIRFERETGVPVVIDGAASFDSVFQTPKEFLGRLPVVFSFHATKSFGIGEGGGVAVDDPTIARKVAQALNFGFNGERESVSSGLNGKLSEYHAAVGLATLDLWKEKLSKLLDIGDLYRREFDKVGLPNRALAAPDISSSYALFASRDNSETKSVLRTMAQAKIQSRMWYGSGVHTQPYFSSHERASLPVTEALTRRLIGIPMSPDLNESDVARVATSIANGVRDNRESVGQGS